MEEQTVKNRWSVLLKFGSKENLKKLQSGQLYMKNLKYYVDLEKNTSDENVGDMYDGQMMIEDVNLSMYTTDNYKFLGPLKGSRISMDLGYSKYPVFCMFKLDDRNYTNEKLEGNKLKERYEFTKEQLQKLPNFGEYVLMIRNNNKFIERINNGFLSKNIEYSKDSVQYYGCNNLKRLQQIQDDNSRIAFWKRQKYAYQQEYRFLAHIEVDDFLSVDIGDISDITQLIKTKDLLNTYLEVNFQEKTK